MAKSKKTEPERVGPQSFHEWLDRHARGTLNDEATVGLAEVVQSVTDLGKAGKLTIEVTVEPAGSGGRTVAIGGKVLKKFPQPSPELGVFYVGDGGSLHRDDPYQQRIPGVAPATADALGEVRQVEAGAEEVRTVEDAAAPAGRGRGDPMTDVDKTETEAAAELAARPEVIDDGTRDTLTVILPPGWSDKTIDLERFQPSPRRARGRILVHDAASFEAAVKRRSNTSDTTIYADESANALVAILNDDGADQGVGGWRDYSVALHLRATPEWRHWREHDGHLMSQEEFAGHIENGLVEITQPEPATMLEVAQTFHATTNATFKAGTRLSSGATQFQYDEDVTAKAGAGGTLEVPEFIQLVLAPFYGSARYEVSARFRYRLARGAFAVGYKLDRPHEVERAAFADVHNAVKEGLGDWHFIAGPAPEGIGG